MATSVVTSSSENTEQTAGWQGFQGGQGAVSFWVKPSYRPESSGKVRSLFDFSRYHSDCSAFRIHKSPFGLWFLPMQRNGSAPNLRQPRSLLFAASAPTDDIIQGVDYGGTTFAFGKFAPSVNSVGTPSESSKPNLMVANKWTHVMMSWKLTDPSGRRRSTATQGARLFLNGKEVGSATPGTNLGDGLGKYTIWYHDPMQVTTRRTTRRRGSTTARSTITRVRGQHANTMQLGNPSKKTVSQGPAYGGNFPADATFDEFFAWDNPDLGVTGGLSMWNEGRYHGRGLDGDSWVSEPLSFSSSSFRTLAPPTPMNAPTSTGASAGTDAVRATPKVTIRGVSCTWYGEEAVGMGSELKRILYNYNSGYRTVAQSGFTYADSNTPKPQRWIEPGVEVAILQDNNVVATAHDDGFSKMHVSFDPTMSDVRFGVRFTIVGSNGSAANPILLASPVVDDVTIYYSVGGHELLEYHQVMK